MANLELTPGQWDHIRAFFRTRSDLYFGNEDQCRRFVTATLWIARSGAPWRLLPPEYGHWNSVYKRYARPAPRFRGCRGIWTAFLQHLAADPDTEYLIIDRTIVRAHPAAAGAAQKGAAKKPKT